eukprot:scaffold67230_cov61-Phaeocystis_antarctica.AAC.2
MIDLFGHVRRVGRGASAPASAPVGSFPPFVWFCRWQVARRVAGSLNEATHSRPLLRPSQPPPPLVFGRLATRR